MNIVAYSVVGKGEADRYLEKTLANVQSYADMHIICLNKATQKEVDLANKYDCVVVEDNREWGVDQWRIKEDLVRNIVSQYEPDWCIGIDADEQLYLTREELEQLCKQGVSYYFYVANLFDNGYSPELGTWVIRLWKWVDDLSFKQQSLHGGIAPEWAYISGSYAPYPLIHYGLQDKENRERKLKRYEKYDNIKKSAYSGYYNLLKNAKPIPFNLVELKEELHEYTKDLKIKDMVQPQENKEFYLVKRLEDGKIIDIPAKDLEFTLKRKQNGKKLFELHQETPIKVKSYNDVRSTVVVDKKKTEVIEESRKTVKEETSKGVACDICPFLAKTKQGLKVHQRTHS